MNGILAFGLWFGPDFIFPWDDKDKWWHEICDCKIVSPYTDEGEYKLGVQGNDPCISAYFDALRAWDKENPMPVDIVYCGYNEDPETILASYSFKQYLDEPLPIECLPKVDAQPLLDFCNKYGIKYSGEPRWLLTARGS